MAVLNMRVLIEMVDSLGIEKRNRAFNAVDFVALLQKEFSEIRSILSSNSRDEGFLQAELLLEV